MSNKQKIFCCKFCERNFYEHERKQHEQECNVKRAIEEHQNVENKNDQNNENPYNNVMGEDTKFAWKILADDVNEHEDKKDKKNDQNNENPFNNDMGDDTRLAWQLLFNDVNNIEKNKNKLKEFKDGFPNN